MYKRQAPEGTEVVLLTDTAEPDLADGVPAGARQVASIPLEHREGTIGVYRDPGS